MSDRCELAALVPGLEQVVAPRAVTIAEVLALECGDGVGAPRALYDALAADLETIAAVDPRMRLERAGDPWVYPFSSPLAAAPMFTAQGDDLPAARAALDPATCAFAMTEALHGTATEEPAGLHDPFVRIDFSARLHPRVVVRVYATLGIALTTVSASVGDGSRAAFRETDSGREFLLEVRGGDCPSGCTFGRSFWWRVSAGRAELVAEWGSDLDSRAGGTWDPPPPDFDPAGFPCAKCADGHATREVTEGACADGRDGDCDALIDCDDPDCAPAVPCLVEECANGVDDNADGLLDCGDPDCAASLACGARTACEADGDRTFLAAFAQGGQLSSPAVLAGLDRQAAACSQREAAHACFVEFFAANGVSAQCSDCLTVVGLCLAKRCPWIGHTDAEHASCIAQCEPALGACLP